MIYSFSVEMHSPIEKILIIFVEMIAKKYIIGLLALVFFQSCTEKDTIQPFIRLNGLEHMYVSLGGEFQDPGAFAKDETDGPLVVARSGKVKTDSVSDYTLTYLAVDHSGNQAQVQRTVSVANDAEKFIGSYKVAQTCDGRDSTYITTVSSSATENNKLIIKDFAFYQRVYAYVVTTDISVSLPNQTKNHFSSTIGKLDLRADGAIQTKTAEGFDLQYNLIVSDTARTPNSSYHFCKATYTRQ